jgi:hypothetical protein
MLRWAAHGGHHGLVVELLRRGAAVDARNRNGNTALIFGSLGGDRPQVVEALLAAGASVDASNKHGNNPLAWAALKGHEGVVRTLLASGADPTLMSPNAYTPEQLTSSEPIRAMLHAVGGARSVHPVHACMREGGRWSSPTGPWRTSSRSAPSSSHSVCGVWRPGDASQGQGSGPGPGPNPYRGATRGVWPGLHILPAPAGES